MLRMDVHETEHPHSKTLPVGSHELRRAHHVENVEVGGEKQRLVHRPSFPRSLACSLTQCQRMLEGGGVGAVLDKVLLRPRACLSSRRMTPATCNRREIIVLKQSFSTVSEK